MKNNHRIKKTDLGEYECLNNWEDDHHTELRSDTFGFTMKLKEAFQVEVFSTCVSLGILLWGGGVAFVEGLRLEPGVPTQTIALNSSMHP